LSKRLRDPVHGLIVFDDVRLDQLAWSLIGTPEFQRLRRIRQLGVSEFTFPGAVHTRFAHSIGVFHTARALANVIRREMAREGGKKAEEEKLQTALVAALLHDLGHGPFSHTFEGVQEALGAKKRHERWTAEIIRNPDGGVSPLLERFRIGFTEEVAGLFEKEDPEDIYHAIVSSSFDADRLDYLRRDKLMTGTGAGAIDFDWLMENVRVAGVSIEAPDADENETVPIPTFCLASKALPAAEQFLLARYTLHQQVYFHKVTRCVEHMIRRLLIAVARAAANGTDASKLTGLHPTHPLLLFLVPGGSEAVAAYLKLDDAALIAAFDPMSDATDPVIADTARRLRNRDLFKALDLHDLGRDQGARAERRRRILKHFAKEIDQGTVIDDDKAAISIYAEIGGDEERMHKKLHILDGQTPTEISRLSAMIQALEKKEPFYRFFFADPAQRHAARLLRRSP
jgi:hypothetical protein